MAKIITRLLPSHFVAAPPWIFTPSPLSTPFSCFFPTLFSTLAHDGDNPLHSPFALFAASKFNLSSADISRVLNKTPSLNTLKTLQNTQRVVHILTEHGCTYHQIAQIIMKRPVVLRMSAEEILEPKIQLLKNYGVQGEILAKVLNLAPTFLDANLERSLIPNIALLKSVFKSQDSLLKAISKAPSILSYNHERILKPSLAFWEGCGLSGHELSKFLLLNPLLMSFPSRTPAHLDLIRRIGTPQGSKMYKSMLRTVAVSRMETLEAKIQNLQRCGLSPEETRFVIRVNPSTLTLSEENVRKKMDFIVNQMELPANIVVKNSCLLGMSLEKVMKPRFLIVQKIKSMKGAENLKRKSLIAILRMPEARFLRSIIKEHPESSILHALYQDVVANASASKKIASKGSLFWRGGVVSELKEL